MNPKAELRSAAPKVSRVKLRRFVNINSRVIQIGGALHSPFVAHCGCRRRKPVAGMAFGKMRRPTRVPGRRVSPRDIPENSFRASTAI